VREEPTFSVNILNLFEDSYRAMGEDWTSRVIYGVRKKDRSYTRYRNAEEHENLVIRMHSGPKVGYNGVTYLMKETDMLKGKAGREE
jgi:hypothetical protein